MRKTKRIFTKVLAAALVIGSVLTPIAGSKAYADDPEAISSGKAGTQLRNVMYYGDWSIWGGQGNFYPKGIPADKLTHLNYSFINFDANGNLLFTDNDAALAAEVGYGTGWSQANSGLLTAFQELRSQNPNLKIGASFGGWSKSANFSIVAADPKRRAHFIDQIIKFTEFANFDFVDLDWEYPCFVRQPDRVDNKNDEGTPNSKPEDKKNFVTLLNQLRTELNKKGQENGKYYELSVALPAPKKKVDEGIDVKGIFKAVDFANIMTYDMRGAWDNTSGHHSGLYPNPNETEKGNTLSVSESVDYYMQNGAPANKIVIGAAFYTRGWEKVTGGTDPKNPGLFGKAEQITKDADQTPSYGAKNELPLSNGDGGRMSGVWTQRGMDKLKKQYPGLKEYWDDTAKAPYLYDDKSGAFFTFDNARSITEKVKYVKAKGLGGMITWMASMDAPTSSGKRDALTTVMKEALFGKGALPKYEIKYPNVNVSVNLEATYDSTSWVPEANRRGFKVTITNNESAQYSGIVGAVEYKRNSVKLPVFYIKGNYKKGDYGPQAVAQKDGYTVVDYSNAYQGANMIRPGTSITFSLKGQGVIEEMFMAQKFSKTGIEVGKQQILGKGATQPIAPIPQPIPVAPEPTPEPTPEPAPEPTPEPTPEQPVVPESIPEFTGVENITIDMGTQFDPKAGVKATDKIDGDLTEKIRILGEVKTDKAGRYTLSYFVTNSQGKEAKAMRTVTVKEVKPEEKPEEEFGTGKGHEWPKQTMAPFVDMVAWTGADKEGYSNSGAANLKKISEESGVQYFNLGFLQSLGSVKDGKVVWGWGQYPLNEQNKETPAYKDQYNGIKKSIRELREIGGDVTISFGGAAGTPFWATTQDEKVLAATYRELIKGYGLTRIDLDIEAAGRGYKQNTANAKAIKRIQDETGVKVSLTLPVMDFGLIGEDLKTLQAYLEQGVNVEIVNIMAMCYGSSAGDYANASVKAIDNTKKQLQDYYKKYAKITLSEGEAYAKIGVTTSIGYETSSHPIFTKEQHQKVVDHAQAKKIGMVSFWSMNRDAMLQNNSAIKEQYGYTNISLKFGKEEPISKPEFQGVKDQVIHVGDAFDAMAGVTAKDGNGKDLTGEIQVEGVVDTSKASSYSLTYKVKDSAGNETSVSCTITVAAVEPEPTPEPTPEPEPAPEQDQAWQSDKIYTGGEIVTYKGNWYKAKWWIQYQAPDQSAAWEQIIEPNSDGSINYQPGKAYAGGTIVKYNGKNYKAKWWTNSTPGSDSTWTAL